MEEDYGLRVRLPWMPDGNESPQQTLSDLRSLGGSLSRRDPVRLNCVKKCLVVVDQLPVKSRRGVSVGVNHSLIYNTLKKRFSNQVHSATVVICYTIALRSYPQSHMGEDNLTVIFDSRPRRECRHVLLSSLVLHKA